MSLRDANINLNKTYGDIVSVKGVMGRPDIVITFNPKDFEQVNKNNLLYFINILKMNVKILRYIEMKVLGLTEETSIHFATLEMNCVQISLEKNMAWLQRKSNSFIFITLF